MATLYIVATPIGNLEDMTHRAVRILQEVDLVLCEDTRVTKKLLSHFGIDSLTKSYHEYSSDTDIQRIVEMLEDGSDIALVSDAGTPAVSDPGAYLVSEVRRRLPEATIIPVPGVSAVTAAISASGSLDRTFTFYGFLPHKKGRATLIKKMIDSEYVSVVYESPHRVLKLLNALVDSGVGDRTVFIAREMTKVHEEYIQNSVQGVLDHYTRNPDRVRGEFVVILSALDKKSRRGGTKGV